MFKSIAMLNQESVEKAINEACANLYQKWPHIIEEHLNERTIVADFIAPHLRREFPEWDVNTDFNREGVDRGPKTDLTGRLLLPDIIIHKHGPDGPNVAAIQVKGHWNREDRNKDEESLKRIQAKHGYAFLFRLELEHERHQLIRVA